MVTVESQTITTGTTSVEVGEVGDEEAAARPPLSAFFLSPTSRRA